MIENQTHTATCRAYGTGTIGGRRVRERILDLAVLFSVEQTLLARTGRAVLDSTVLPHPILNLIEDLYPNDVARARFKALWSQHSTPTADPVAVGIEFRDELADLFRRRGCLVEPLTIIIHEK